jgi:hypothetical protein
MTYTEMLETLKKLTLTKRLALMEAVLHLTREELQQREQQPAIYERTERLAAAAQTLLPDYTTDTELTSFTALDSEDFRDNDGYVRRPITEEATHDQSIR